MGQPLGEGELRALSCGVMKGNPCSHHKPVSLGQGGEIMGRSPPGAPIGLTEVQHELAHEEALEPPFSWGAGWGPSFGTAELQEGPLTLSSALQGGLSAHLHVGTLPGGLDLEPPQCQCSKGFSLG